MPDPDMTILHASCVSLRDRAVLIMGPSGSGKSSLALQLMALGADLVADDRTCLRVHNNTLIAQSPDTIAGLIEARHIGIFAVSNPHKLAREAQVVLAVDLGRTETQRLPDWHSHDALGVTIPCLWRVEAAHFASTILLYLNQTIALRP